MFLRNALNVCCFRQSLSGSCAPMLSQVRTARHIKPWSIGPEGEFRKKRAQKVIKVELPDFDAMRREDRLTPDEIRSKLKEKGVAPPRHYVEKPMFIACTEGILEPYVPPEGDGKMSIISGTGAVQRVERIGKKGKSFMALRKIRTYEDDFDFPTFAEQALEIYIKAHNALAAKELDLLHDYVTEHAFPEMTFKIDLTTIKWQFIKSLETPLVSHVRTIEMLAKSNLFAQITVRLHTRQILAIYDRFGYLMHGSEAVVKDVLEYVVFEKHIVNQYGKWRLHAKIIPDWMPPKESIRHTFVAPPKPPPMTEEEIKAAKKGLLSDQSKDEEKEKEKDKEKQLKGGDNSPQPALA